jgi:O-antigen ligase
MNSRRVITLFGSFLIISLFCNDKTNYGAIHAGINIRLDRIAYAFLLFAFLGQPREAGRGEGWLLEEKLMVMFFFVLLMSCFVGGGAFVAYNRYLAELFGFSFVPATLFMVSRRLTYDTGSLRILWIVFVTIGLYLGFTGSCEHCQLRALVFPKYILDSSVGLHVDRVRGPFVQSAVMGVVLIIIGLWLLWYHFNVRRTWLTWVAFFPMLASIYWTNTRGAWVQLAGSLLPLTFFRNPLRKPIWLMLLGILITYFSGIASKFSAYQSNLFQQRSAQVDDRINIYHASWRMFLERPLLGFGYGNFAKYSDDYFEELPGVELRGQGEGQHNTILGLMCETGIVGAVPYCLVYFMLLRTCYRRFQDTEGNEPIGGTFALMQFSILTGNVVGMQFSDFGFYVFINNLTFWLSGMVYAKLETVASESVEQNPEPPVGAEIRESAAAG